MARAQRCEFFGVSSVEQLGIDVFCRLAVCVALSLMLLGCLRRFVNRDVLGNGDMRSRQLTSSVNWLLSS